MIALEYLGILLGLFGAGVGAGVVARNMVRALSQL